MVQDPPGPPLGRPHMRKKTSPVAAVSIEATCIANYRLALRQRLSRPGQRRLVSLFFGTERIGTCCRGGGCPVRDVLRRPLRWPSTPRQCVSPRPNTPQ